MGGLARRAVIMAAAGAGVLAAGVMGAGASQARVTPTVLFAAVTAAGSGDCSAAADACALSTALADVAAGEVIELITPGLDTAGSRYVGNWTVSTSGTSASAPVTIEAAAGLASQPVLDGDGPDAPPGESCSTTSCDGPVLTVPPGEYVSLSGITIADGNENSSFEGGGLYNAGTVTITGCVFTGDSGLDGGAIDNGDGFAPGGGYGGPGTGSVTVTASTFSDNTSTIGGGAINSGYAHGGGSVTVTDSTFAANHAGDGGAIDSGDSGGGSVTVTDSTFSGNTGYYGGAIDSADGGGGGSMTVSDSTFSDNNAQFDGGAINSGDFNGGGSVTVVASTFVGNTAFTSAGTIASGNSTPGGGTITLAGDLFDGSCSQRYGTWIDLGFNAGSDASCFHSGPRDVDAGSAAALRLGPLASNGGPTQTVAPRTTRPVSKAIRIIPRRATVTADGSKLVLCPTTDQRGYHSAAGTACDAGAVQTSGLVLKDAAAPRSFNRVGQVISYRYTVSNTSAGTLTQITVTDPAVPVISCPAASLAPRASEMCSASRAVTKRNLAAGKITDTATATGTTANGVPVTSNSSTVTLREGWPPVVSGIFRPHPHQAKGYYLGVKGSTWTLIATHPGSGEVVFTGTVTLNAGAFRKVTRVDLERGDSVHVHHRTLTFRFTDFGDLDGVRFATTPANTSITFALTIDGHPASARQIYLAGTHTHARHGSPIRFRR